MDKKALNIFSLVEEFYAIEALCALLVLEDKYEPMRHSHQKWYTDFCEFKDEYAKRLASAIFDYTVLVVAGELRHCKRWASQCIRGYFSPADERNYVFFEAADYRPYDILRAGIRLFDTTQVRWHRNYGGYKWNQIAKSGLKKGSVKDAIFIDHCVDLSHNSCSYFDKGAGIFAWVHPLHYTSMLDKKRVCDPYDLLCEKYGKRFNKLLFRAANLGIVEIPFQNMLLDIQKSLRAVEKRIEAEETLLSYTPMEWGTRFLDYSDDNIAETYVFNDAIENRFDYRRPYENEQYRRRIQREEQQKAA